MTTKLYSPSLHRTCFLVLGCLSVLNCLVIFVIWEKTLKRGSSSIKVPVDFVLCYKDLWPVEKAFALMWFFPKMWLRFPYSTQSWKFWLLVWLASVVRLSVAADRVLNHSLLSLDDLPSNALRALFIHRPCSSGRTSAWVRMMPSIHPVGITKGTCCGEAVYW